MWYCWTDKYFKLLANSPNDTGTEDKIKGEDTTMDKLASAKKD